MSNHKDDLLPCPFCGGKAEFTELEEDDYGNEGGGVVECSSCGASSHVEFNFKENLISAWNTRADLAQPSIDVSNWEIKLFPISAEELAAAKSQEIKAAEAAALRRAAEVAVAHKVRLWHHDPDDPSPDLVAQGYHNAISNIERSILHSITPDQSSALDAYVKAKVGEALERAAVKLDELEAKCDAGITDSERGLIASGAAIAFMKAAAAIRAMKE